MTNKLLILFIVLPYYVLNASEPRNEAKAEISGVGRVKAKADYVRLTFNVRSECYDTPSEAQSATDQAVAKINEYLKTLKSPGDKYFKILVNGGFTSQFSKWHGNKEYCRNTFQKNTEINLNIGLSGDFSALFARIQGQTLSLYAQGQTTNAFDKAQTFVSINTPEPRISRLNRAMLEGKARSLALIDAKNNFKETVASCDKQPFKIINIKEGISHFPQQNNRYYQNAMPSARVQSVEIAPVQLNDLLISKELIVTFQVDGTLCFENAR